MRRGKLIRNIVLCTSALILIFFLYKEKTDKNKLKKNAILLNGVELLKASKVMRSYSIYTCHFIFFYKGKRIETYQRNSIDINIKTSLLVGKSFPIIYENGNPSNTCILISKESFKKFDIPFPDSLKWLYNSPF